MPAAGPPDCASGTTADDEAGPEAGCVGLAVGAAATGISSRGKPSPDERAGSAGDIGVKIGTDGTGATAALLWLVGGADALAAAASAAPWLPPAKLFDPSGTMRIGIEVAEAGAARPDPAPRAGGAGGGGRVVRSGSDERDGASPAGGGCTGGRPVWLTSRPDFGTTIALRC